MNIKTTALSLAAVAFAASAAMAQQTTPRIQTHFALETVSGQLARQCFDAAATGVLNCDMTGGAYQTGKNPAFQFGGGIMGGYTTPYQQLSGLYFGGGFDAAQDLYGMHPVSWRVPGQESLSSSKPIASTVDFRNWKFRSPPGMEPTSHLSLSSIGACDFQYESPTSWSPTRRPLPSASDLVLCVCLHGIEKWIDAI